MVSDRVAAALVRMSDDGDAGGEQQKGEAPKHRLKLSPSQVAASSLAACCSALVASFLGIAGTIGGAAIGSVVATTGTAVYGHALRKGSTKIVRRLGSSTVVASQGEPQPPAPEWTQTELPLSPEAAGADADTSADEAAAAEVGSVGAWPRPAKTKYRNPIALAAALLVVFGTAIIVGLLAGGPIRQAGTGYNFTRPQPAATQHSATASAGPAGSSSASAGTSPSASASASAAASGSATSSGLASPSQGQGAAVSQAPTG